MEKKFKLVKGKRPQKYIIRFMERPNLQQFLGIVVNKDTDIDDMVNENIHQTIKNNILTTEIHKSQKAETDVGTFQYKEDSIVQTTVPDGTRLIWIPDVGYTLPTRKVCSVSEAIDELNTLNDVKGTEYREE